MTVVAIDLDALDCLDDLDNRKTAGKPMLLALDLVHEDPSQPRKTFDDTKQRELSASIAESGIRVPISVRPHPDLTGHFMLNFGARRRRAAISVGLTVIPALIDELLTDFDQVIENQQRAELTPMEMALFITEKQKQGMKAADIARRLGLTRSAISKYFALIDAPPEIEAVYTAGRSTSPDTIYELRSVYNRWPVETKAWLAKDVDVTRRSIDALKDRLLSGAVDEHAMPIARRLTSDPSVVRRPIIVIKVSDRIGTLVLKRRASDDIHVLVEWHDTAEIEEVRANVIQIVRLDDAELNRSTTRSVGSGRPRGRSRELSR